MTDPELVAVNLDSSTAALGGSITGTITATYDAPSVNPNIVADVVGYFQGRGENVIGTGTLKDGTVEIPFSLSVPNDPSMLGDQWIYVGLDTGPWSSLKGTGVTIVSEQSSSGSESSDSGSADGGAGLGESAALALIGLGVVGYAFAKRR